MKIYAFIPQQSPLQFYQLLQTTYPSCLATHHVPSDQVVASGPAWHWTTTTDLVSDHLTIVGIYKGAATDFEKALLTFKDALEAQQMIYLLEYEVPTSYGHTSRYFEHPTYQSMMTPQNMSLV